MKKALFLFLFACICSSSFSQTLDWVRHLTEPSSHDTSVYDAASFTVDVVTCSDGGTISTGYFMDTVDFDPGLGVFLMYGNMSFSNNFLLKLDSAGNFVWAKNWQGWEAKAVLDQFDNIYLTFVFSGPCDVDPDPIAAHTITPALQYGLCVLKLNPTGNFIWAKQFNSGASGGDPCVGMSDIKVSNSGNLILGGYFKNSLDMDPGPGTSSISPGGYCDGLLISMDVSGNLIWYKNFPASGISVVQFYSVEMDAFGNITCFGNFEGTLDADPGAGSFPLVGSGSIDVFIVQLNSAGNFNWAGAIGDGGLECALDATIDPQGNSYIMGVTRGVPDYDIGSAVFNGGGVPLGFQKVFLVKLTNTGNFIWAYEYGNSMASLPVTGFILYRNNFLYIAKNYANAGTDIDPHSGTVPATTNGVFFQKLDTAANLIWGGSIEPIIYAFNVDAWNDIYIGGGINGTGYDLDPNATTFSVTVPEDEALLIKLDQPYEDITFINESEIEKPFKVYPNPANSSITISTEKAIAQKISLLDVYGRTIKTVQPNSNTTTMDLQNIESGIYFVSVVNGNTRQTVKIVKQ